MSLLLLFRPRNTGFVPSPSATITVPALTEAQIRAGGQTIVIDLANDTWLAAGPFDAERQNIINGLLSAQSEALGWNNVVRALQGVAGVVRTSNTEVTITLDAQATYNITALETITVTVPHTALNVSLVDLVATPTFNVTPIVEEIPRGGGGDRRKRKKVNVIRYSDFEAREKFAAALKASIVIPQLDEPHVQEPPKSPIKPATPEWNDREIKVSKEIFAKLQLLKQDDNDIMEIMKQLEDEQDLEDILRLFNE